MKNNSLHNNLLWSVCLSACLPFATAEAAIQYSVADLGSLGGAYSVGLGVNNSGLVSGLSHIAGNVAEHAVTGQALVLPQDLGTLGGTSSQAYSINNLGQLVGSASLLGDTAYHAFQWNGGAAPPLVPLKNLSALTAAGNSRAFSINDKGQATGFSVTALGAEHAVIWQTTGLISDLGTLSGTGNSQGSMINALGDVAGFSSLTGNKATHAVLWSNGTKKDLGTLGGTHSAAYGINALGDVVGSATTALDAEQHAFLWQSTALPQMTDLGTLGGTFSQAHGISSKGDVIGYSFTARNALQKAFLWQKGLVIQDLNALIDPLSGWTLLEAQAISEEGNYITGVGVFNGERHGFLLKSLINDTTPPVISFAITPTAPGVSGWYQTTPGVVWTVTDPESAVTAKVGCVNTPVIGDTSPAGVTLSCAATSTGGTATTVNTPVLKVDSIAPVFVAPTAINKAATSLAGAVVTYALPIASDASSGLSAAGVSCLPASGSAFVVGATPVNCRVSDTAGNVGITGFVVTVSPFVDTTPPVVTSALTGTAGLNGWFTSAVGVAWNAVDAQSAITSVLCAPVSVTTNGANQVRTCVATSAGGTATVNTAPINIDTLVPVFVAPTAITKAATSSAGAVVTYALPLASDASSGLSAAGVSCLPASGSAFVVGATPVNCRVSDNAGNVGTIGFAVTVTPFVDTTPPVVTSALTGTAGLNGWFTSAVGVAWNVVDAQSAITSVPCAPVSVTTNGANQVRTCVATSAGGTATVNTAPISIDTLAPAFASCPATVALTQGRALPVLSATDNLSIPVVSNNAPASLPVGTTAVTWKATDNAGLSATCVQTVTVNTAIVEALAVTRAQCKRVTATTGQWFVQGTSSNSTTNTIQLYSTPVVPAILTASKIGAAATVVKGAWVVQTTTAGPACTTPVSLRSSAGGNVLNNIPVLVQ